MREGFGLRVMMMVISVFMLLAILASALVFASPASLFRLEEISKPFLTGMEIRNPEIALKYGITGYLEITYSSDSPSHLVVVRGGAINITILLHFVSHTPKVTETQVNIDPKSRGGLTIEYRDVNFREFVSYNPSGNITIKAGEPLPVTMTITVPKDLPSYITSIPLGAMGILANGSMIDELGGEEVVVR